MMKKSLYISLLTIVLIGCTSVAAQQGLLNPADSFTAVSDSSKPKSIFVFMDGTGNNPNIPTNIYRLFQEINENNDKQTVGKYIEGVGSVDNPITGITGKALAVGMEDRILKAYAFITQEYQPGDNIYLFGFSRGAHAARSLAGLISYAGIPKVVVDNERKEQTLKNIGNKILELTKNVRDSSYVEYWKEWVPGNSPPLTKLINKKIDTKQQVQPAEVRFLGVWDTVPGSEFKEENYFGDTDLS